MIKDFVKSNLKVKEFTENYENSEELHISGVRIVPSLECPSSQPGTTHRRRLTAGRGALSRSNTHKAHQAHHHHRMGPCLSETLRLDDIVRANILFGKPCPAQKLLAIMNIGLKLHSLLWEC